MRLSRFIGRQIIHSRNQALLFMGCVALSVISVSAINGFAVSIKQALLNDARQLHGADIIITANQPFSNQLSETVKQLIDKGQVQAARIHEFYAMVRNEDKNTSLLAQIKIAQSGYPFYGHVVTGSAKPLTRVLRPGQVVVAPAINQRLGLKLGAQIRIGSAGLAVADTVLQEPDKPISLFSLGPRVFVHASDLNAIDLVQKGSRVRHRLLLKVIIPTETDHIAGVLKTAAVPNREQVNTFATAPSRIKRFFDNLIFFLRLMGIFTLLLAGIGINSTLRAFLGEKKDTIAIMKTLGATNHYIIGHFMAIVLVLGLIGTVAGIVLGVLLQHLLPVILSGLVPLNLELIISKKALAQSFLLGLLVVALYTCLPLYRLKDLKPVVIFGRRANAGMPGWASFFIVGIIGAFFAAMIFWQLGDTQTGLYFVAGAIAFLLIIAGLVLVTLYLIKKIRFKNLAARQSLKGLFRPRNATVATIMAIAASLTVIMTIYLVSKNLDAAYVDSYPPDAPNLFFIDIQPDQTETFIKALPEPVPFYPIVRARIATINGHRIDPKKERRRRRDNLGRMFSLTYRTHLLADEVLTVGDTLYRDDWTLPQVSVLDMVTEMTPLKIGDEITFNIQGVTLKARVASIRSRSRKSLTPYFYFVFPPDVIKDAPQTAFAALKIDPSKIPTLQDRLAAQFPNVSVIDMTATVAFFAGQMTRLSMVIRFFALFSIIAGILILVSAVFATRAARIKEAVYFKILGARPRFVSKVFVLENLFLGTTSGVIALLLAQTASFMLCRFRYEIDHHAFWVASAVMLFFVNILVAGIGRIATRSILTARPATYLRNNTDV